HLASYVPSTTTTNNTPTTQSLPTQHHTIQHLPRTPLSNSHRDMAPMLRPLPIRTTTEPNAFPPVPPAPPPRPTHITTKPKALPSTTAAPPPRPKPPVSGALGKRLAKYNAHKPAGGKLVLTRPEVLALQAWMEDQRSQELLRERAERASLKAKSDQHDLDIAALQLGFRELKERSTALEIRITASEGRSTALEIRITASEERSTALERRMTTLEERSTALERRVQEHSELLTALGRSRDVGQAQLEGLVGREGREEDGERAVEGEVGEDGKQGGEKGWTTKVKQFVDVE
ncbi:hypothetical protein DFH27DRAFT_310165, partial [Peziza echinospora]